MLTKGLSILQVDPQGRNVKSLMKTFQTHYGSSHVVLTSMWNDICKTNEEMSKKEKSSHGVKFFLMAHYYLWNYPRNSTQVATRFKVCEKYARGEHLWKWIGQIEALKEKAIKWTKNLDDKNTFVILDIKFDTDGRIMIFNLENIAIGNIYAKVGMDNESRKH